MRTRPSKAVNLESEEDTSVSTNLGMITFDGVSYNLPNNTSKTVVTYSVEYFADAGYSFDHWEPTGLISVSNANANPTTVTVSGDGTLKAVYASHHTEHYHEDYAPMVIPINAETLTVAPAINCTTFEDSDWTNFHYPCQSAKTTLTDDDWSNGDANYTYVFEDWTDNDWNDIKVSLHAVTNDIIHVEICVEDREAGWKNPFSVKVTPESLTVDIYWNSTDYLGDHFVQVNPNETVDITLFAESDIGDIAFIKIIPVIVPRYMLTITSTSGGTTDPVPDSYLYDEGTVVPVKAISESGYDFDYWKLDEVDTGSANPIDVPMNSNHTLLAVFKQQSLPKYYLTVISPYGTPGGEGWYDNCTTAYATLDTGIVDHGNGTRRVFTHWSGDVSGTDYSNSNLIHMDQNKTAVANWKTQYKLTVKTDPIGLNPAPTPPTDWYDKSTNVNLTAQTVSGYTFTHWDVDTASQDSGVNPITVHIDVPHTATAHYQPEAQPPPVGGHAMPIDNSHLLAPKIGLVPGIGLASILLAAMAATIILIRCRNKRSSRNSKAP